MTDGLNTKIKKIDWLLAQPLSPDARRIWKKHKHSLENIRIERAQERVEALARLGGAFIEQ
jgi:hypothetical protein|tara:strand:+ start:120 stop:302 length:183 start_codon:yes stop_codon:yes gene_type:complete